MWKIAKQNFAHSKVHLDDERNDIVSVLKKEALSRGHCTFLREFHQFQVLK